MKILSQFVSKEMIQLRKKYTEFANDLIAMLFNDCYKVCIYLLDFDKIPEADYRFLNIISQNILVIAVIVWMKPDGTQNLYSAQSFQKYYGDDPIKILLNNNPIGGALTNSDRYTHFCDLNFESWEDCRRFYEESSPSPYSKEKCNLVFSAVNVCPYFEDLAEVRNRMTIIAQGSYPIKEEYNEKQTR